MRKAVTDILARIRPAGSAASGSGPGSRGGRNRPGATKRPGRGGRSRTPVRLPAGASAADELADLTELPVDELQRLVVRLEQEMRLAAAELRYEEAALLRDDIAELRLALAEAEETATPGALTVPVPTA